MKGTYWKLKGQADTITKMEEVLGEDNVDMLYSHFFYDLPDFYWDDMESDGDERLKGVVDSLWGYTLKGDYNLYDIQSFKDFGEDWIDCYDCMDKDLSGAFFNPMLYYLLYETSVEEEVYALFDGYEDEDGNKLYDKIEAEFDEGGEEGDNKAFDVCMWWFIMGVAYAASGMFKRKYEALKKMYESQEWKDNLANYDYEYIPMGFEEHRAEVRGWAFKDTYEHLREQRAKMEA